MPPERRGSIDVFDGPTVRVDPVAAAPLEPRDLISKVPQHRRPEAAARAVPPETRLHPRKEC